MKDDSYFSSVQTSINSKTGHDVQYHAKESRDVALDNQIKALLEKPLTPDSAAQIALLNNPGLQAKFSKLGIAAADIAQAGVMLNPHFGALVLIPESTGKPTFTLDIAFNLLHLILMPLRSSLAEAAFKEVELDMERYCLDLITNTKIAYNEAVSSQHLLKLQVEKYEIYQTSNKFTLSLRQAGNIPELDAAVSDHMHALADIDRKTVEEKARVAKSNLVELLGLNENENKIVLPDKLLTPNAAQTFEVPKTEDLIKNSLDLARIKQEIETTGISYKVNNITALIPNLNIGGEAEHEEEHWKYGPSVELALPLFDQGSIQKEKATIIIRGLQEKYLSVKNQIFAMRSTLANRLNRVQRQLSIESNNLLPKSNEIMRLLLLQYNAMQKGIDALLKAKMNLVDLQIRNVKTIQEYWDTVYFIEEMRFGAMPMDFKMNTISMDGSTSGFAVSGGH